MCIYLAVRKIIPASWLNDKDQFLYPNDGWESDLEFQSDCLIYTLFHGSNIIRSAHGINHWIPFTERDVKAKEKFLSNFMTDFISGKPVTINNSEPRYEQTTNGVEEPPKRTTELEFSDRAKDVFTAGKELWKYYHSQSDINVNASFYDIREYFQGRSAAGRMNSTSKDERYNKLLQDLKQAMIFLAKKIEPKIYEYGFLFSEQ
jgi:hypothetical protein